MQSLIPSPDLTRPVATSLVAPDGSWCEVAREPGTDGRRPLSRGGPSDLWDRVETAWDQWTQHGQPAWSDFGLTVTPDEHRVWLGEPIGTSWPPPTP